MTTGRKSLLSARPDALFVRHASVQAIEAALTNARAEAKIAGMRVVGLGGFGEITPATGRGYVVTDPGRPHEAGSTS